MIIGRRKNPILLISTLFLTAYAFFPSFLPNLILFGRIVVQSTVTRGYAASQIGSTGLFTGLHYEIPYVLILFLPYILTIPAVVSIAITWSDKAHSKNREHSVVCGLSHIWIYYACPLSDSRSRVNPSAISVWFFLPSIFIFFPQAVSSSLSRLLSIWFLVSFLPFYKIYTEDVHLAPASIPWIIIVLVWISRLPTLDNGGLRIGTIKIASQSRSFKLIRVVLLSIIIIGFAQQTLNVYAVYSTFNGMTQEVETITNLMLNASPPGGLRDCELSTGRKHCSLLAD